MLSDATALEHVDLNEYEDYAQLRSLLALQRPRTDAPAELSFIVVTQVMELYFTLLRREWESAREDIVHADVRGAVRSLRRGHGVQDALTAAWEALRTLTPAEFDAFRESLGVASGIQSTQYRHLEFLLGVRRRREPAVHDRAAGLRAGPAARRAALSLYDATLGLLRRRGLAVPDELADRDCTTQYEGDDRAVAVWRTVFADDSQYTDLVELGDALLDTAERQLRWKQRHLLAVWRSMGGKPGTAGTSGARWLERSVHHRYFPDLWNLRDQGWSRP
jgi:tryptophan 2,3-dioxygenase